MATRHQSRTAVVGLLYAYDLGNENIGDFKDEILEEGKIRNKQREFSHGLFNGTIGNLEMLDKEIEINLKGWDYAGIGKVEKAIMRLAAYEILIVKTDKAIIINEAVELAKALADDKSPQFINGVLDALGSEKVDAVKADDEIDVEKDIKEDIKTEEETSAENIKKED